MLLISYINSHNKFKTMEFTDESDFLHFMESASVERPRNNEFLVAINGKICAGATIGDLYFIYKSIEQ